MRKITVTSDGGVYPPSEDSFLLMSAVKKAKGNVLDMCAGSGIIGLNAAKYADHVTLVDINEKALSSIRKAARIRRIKNFSIVRSDLFSSLHGEVFDTIYMNPPYLPDSRTGSDIDLALNGGKHGYELTMRAIAGIKQHLAPGGSAFVILSTAYDTKKVYKLIKSFKLNFEILGTRSFFFEDLILIRIYGKRRTGNVGRTDNSSRYNKRCSATSQGKNTE